MDDIKMLLESLVHKCLRASNGAEDEGKKTPDKSMKSPTKIVAEGEKTTDEDLKRQTDVDEEDEKADNEMMDEDFYEEEEFETIKDENSFDKAVNNLYSVFTPSSENMYVSSNTGIELGKQIYG